MATVNPSASTPPIWAGRQASTGPRSSMIAKAGNARTSPTPQPAAPTRARPMPASGMPALGAAGMPTSLKSLTAPRANALPPAPPTAAPEPGGDLVSMMGDVDGNGQVDSADGKALLSYLFNGDPMPGGLENADLNGDGAVDIADAMRMFQTGTPDQASTPEGPGTSPPTSAPLPVSFQQARASTGYAKTLGLLAVSRKI